MIILSGQGEVGKTGWGGGGGGRCLEVTFMNGPDTIFTVNLFTTSKVTVFK